MTLLMWFTAASSCRSSMPITTSAVFCRSMSTTRRWRDRWRYSCVPARRLLVRRCAAICAGSSAASAAIGRRPPSPIRGDGHYGRPQAMAWCEENAIDFVFGLPGNAVLADAVEATADDIRTRRALDRLPQEAEELLRHRFEIV